MKGIADFGRCWKIFGTNINNTNKQIYVGQTPKKLVAWSFFLDVRVRWLRTEKYKKRVYRLKIDQGQLVQDIEHACEWENKRQETGAHLGPSRNIK